MTDMKPALPFYQMMNLNIELKMVFVYDMPQKSKDSAIEDITIALEDDKLVHRLYKQYELSEISQAHLKIEDKQATYGAVIVKP
jgi:NADPH:quinone reductase-like Zn-dependent oxidoreductase